MKVQALNSAQRRSVYFAQVQNRVSLAVPESNEFCVVSKGSDKVERAGSINLGRALLLNMSWICHIKDGQPSAMVLFDIENGSAVSRCVERHRLPGHLRKFGQFRRAHDDKFVRVTSGFCLACYGKGRYS